MPPPRRSTPTPTRASSRPARRRAAPPMRSPPRRDEERDRRHRLAPSPRRAHQPRPGQRHRPERPEPRGQAQHRRNPADLAAGAGLDPDHLGAFRRTSSINGGEGVENIDLRGLGPSRTLVLLNGRRAGPAGVRGGVAAFDLNVIPQDAIQSVEILKTGASSVYGSDAIAGVVNLITKKDLRGLQVRGFANVPTHPAAAKRKAFPALYGARPWRPRPHHGQRQLLQARRAHARRPQLPGLRRRECHQRSDRRARPIRSTRTRASPIAAFPNDVHLPHRFLGQQLHRRVAPLLGDP